MKQITFVNELGQYFVSQIVDGNYVNSNFTKYFYNGTRVIDANIGILAFEVNSIVHMFTKDTKILSVLVNLDTKVIHAQ
jgi:hypothetical protein